MSSDRLLVVDDDLDMGEIITELGRQIGFEAIHISDPLEARQKIATWSPTVIVSDLQMPMCDGVAFLRMLAAEDCKAKIVILSGMDQKIVSMAGELSKQRGLDLVATFTKPFSNAQLSACLERLRGKQAIDKADVAQALRHDEVEIFFQPKCELKTGRAVGAEALVRWMSPIRGVVMPSDFLHLIEGGGMSDALFDRVLTSALHAAAAYRQARLISETFQIAVNMTAENLTNITLPDRVQAICEAHGWPTSRLTLELTETTSMDDSIDILDVLTRLRLMDIKCTPSAQVGPF